ncbi:MAG: homoserine kinase, partial [Oscillospiraceae bacterium]|nr:homoserine kinase [Oscillospiraceae bacterium]
HIRQENHIPIARGLGSSSACIVAGLAGANALLGGPLSTAQLVDLATEMEGHPDNVAPAFYGGLVTSAMDGNRVYTVHVPVAEGMRFAVFIPPFELKTSDARAALPETVSRADAVYNLSRAALMTASLFSGDTENLRVAMQDRLHQPYRFPLIPGAPQVMEAAYALGAHGVCVSGAGSSLLAFVTHPGAEDFEIRARAALAGEGLADWGVRILECDKKGVQVREMLN